jgi:hypothetical protein
MWQQFAKKKDTESSDICDCDIFPVVDAEKGFKQTGLKLSCQQDSSYGRHTTATIWGHFLGGHISLKNRS